LRLKQNRLTFVRSYPAPLPTLCKEGGKSEI
jgi:hypothetical protein